MEDLLTYGLKNDIFEPKHIMDLLYGELIYFSRKTVPFNEEETFYKWETWPLTVKDWRIIPFRQRMEVIALTIKSAQKSPYIDSNLNCFHDRMLCLMHELLNDDENKTECYDDKGISTRIYYKYTACIHPKMQQALVTEMFLWWHLGIRKSDEERRLLKQCWVKFLGFERKKSLKHTLSAVALKVEELETELKKAQRIECANNALIYKRYVRERKEIKKRHLSKAKKEFLLAQVKEKDDKAYHRFWQAHSKKDRCQIALDFLKGFQDYVSARPQL